MSRPNFKKNKKFFSRKILFCYHTFCATGEAKASPKGAGKNLPAPRSALMRAKLLNEFKSYIQSFNS